MRKRSNPSGEPASRSSGNPVGTLIGLGMIALACLAVGVGMLTVRHYSLRDLAAVKSWTATPCVIEACEFVRNDEDERSLQFTYRYAIDGRSYTGDRLDAIIGRMGDDGEFEERIHDAYPVGASAICYVDPADPSRSIFDREHGADSPRRMWLLAFPFTCIGLGFGLALVLTFIDDRFRDRTKYDEAPPVIDVLNRRPPRRISLLTRASMLAGHSASQLPWLFFVGFSFVFVILDGPASYARLFHWRQDEATVVGRVTGIREMDQRELSITVYEFSFAYDVDGQSFSGRSYMRGEQYDEGEEVLVTYDSASPGDGTIEGARSSSFTWWHSAIPLGVLLLLALGLFGMYRHNYGILWLLRHGEVARASLKPRESAKSDGAPPAALSLTDCEFELDGKTYRARRITISGKTQRGRKHGDGTSGEEVAVLYRRDKPARNVLVDAAFRESIGAGRSVADRLMDCLVAPIAILLIVVLIRGAELV